MIHYILPDPGRRSEYFPGRSPLDKLQILLYRTMRVRVHVHPTQIIINQRYQTWKLSFLELPLHNKQPNIEHIKPQLTFPLMISLIVISLIPQLFKSQFVVPRQHSFASGGLTCVVMSFLNQNVPSLHAFLFCARCILSSTLLIGIKKFNWYDRITLVISTTKQTIAAFSKSVNCTSHGRNSTRQPIVELGGGGLKRIVCQFVD